MCLGSGRAAATPYPLDDGWFWLFTLVRINGGAQRGFLFLNDSTECSAVF